MIAITIPSGMNFSVAAVSHYIGRLFALAVGDVEVTSSVVLRSSSLLIPNMKIVFHNSRRSLARFRKLDGPTRYALGTSSSIRDAPVERRIPRQNKHHLPAGRVNYTITPVST